MTWIRKHKLYSRPQKPFDKTRIEEENVIITSYGLKNKKEIWKAEAAVARIRRRAKKLITANLEEQQELFKKLKRIGLKAETIPDVLALDKKDWLDRKLQSIVFKKKLATTPKEARQLIVHKKISVEGHIVNQPSYLVETKQEGKIELAVKKKKKAAPREAVEASEKTEDNQE